MLIQSYHWKSRFKQDNHKIKHLLYYFLTMQICKVVVLLITLHKYYSTFDFSSNISFHIANIRQNTNFEHDNVFIPRLWKKAHVTPYSNVGSRGI